MNTVIITGLFKYQSIRNLTTKMNTDRILSHHMLIHQNSAMTHHFFHHFMNALPELIFSSSTLYSKACLHIGQNMNIHIVNITITATIARVILNLWIALTKYTMASEISTQELYWISMSQLMK